MLEFQLMPEEYHACMMVSLVNPSTMAQMIKFSYGFIISLKKQETGVVVDGKQSSLIDVVSTSSAPRGTVLGPLSFLLHINDLPSVVSSKVILFPDDCLIDQEIKRYRV